MSVGMCRRNSTSSMPCLEDENEECVCDFEINYDTLQTQNGPRAACRRNSTSSMPCLIDENEECACNFVKDNPGR
jgi:hypothetical protein